MTIASLLQNTETPEVVRNLRMLYSADEKKRVIATQRLAATARESSDRKDEIVSGLINVLDDSTAPFSTRKASMDLLGNLKAAAATGVLTKHLTDVGGTVGFSDAHFPAIQALRKIGPPAIPGLSRALSDPDPSARRLAARALAEIGGDEARSALERALQSEADDEVKHEIQTWLRHTPSSPR
ncbi:MAG TPA: HEAT repeat domain-containing protein [Bryobacteraceae bacterium]